MIDGLVLTDKPASIGSAALVARLKKLTGLRAGHTGTLDRFASGLMILLIGRATVFADYFLKLDKTYEATLQLGSSTDTLDPHGLVLNHWEPARIRDFVRAHREDIVAAVSRRIEQSEQIPPEYSAIKQNGERLSDRARRGVQSELKQRQVIFYDARCLSVTDSGEVKAFFSVSSGTYIRSAARDIGEELGVPVHLSALRRLSVGPYSLSGAGIWPGSDELPRPVGLLDAFPDWPRRTVPDADRLRVRNGARLSFAENRPPDGDFFLLGENGDLLAWGEQTGFTYAYKKVFT